MKDVTPDAFGRSAHKAIVECFVRSKGGRCIGLVTTGFQYINDPANDAAIAALWFAPRVRWKMNLKLCELPRTQREIVSINQQSPLGDVQSQKHKFGNSVYRSGV